jgi:hypothetical protein
MIYPDQDGVGTPTQPNAAVLIENGRTWEMERSSSRILLTAAVEQSSLKVAAMSLRAGVPVPACVKSVEKSRQWPWITRTGARLEELSGILRT